MEIETDGIIWKEIDANPKPDRISVQNIFRDMSGPTEYAKRHIMKEQVKTAFYLIIDLRIREHIIKYTEKEAFRVLGIKRELDATKLDAFIALLYICDAYRAKNLDAPYLWSKIWGLAFFSRTMSRSDFDEIMRFISFDKKSERSQQICNGIYSMGLIYREFTKLL